MTEIVHFCYFPLYYTRCGLSIPKADYFMKKLGLLIAMILCVTIGGVYAAWVYPQSDDVADVTHHTILTLPDATFSGTYGTYAVTPSDDFAMTIDPEAGTTHTTALYITGSITISLNQTLLQPQK